MNLEPGKFCYFIDETMYVGKPGEWRPAIVIEGESGYYPVDYTWKCEFSTARGFVNEFNKRMGISEERAAEIVRSSMFQRGRNGFN